MLKKVLVIVAVILLLAIAGLYYLGSSVKGADATASLKSSQLALLAAQQAACGGSCDKDHIRQLEACDESNTISLKNCISILAPSDAIRNACMPVVDLNQKELEKATNANELILGLQAITQVDLVGVKTNSEEIVSQLAKCTEEARNYRPPA